MEKKEQPSAIEWLMREFQEVGYISFATYEQAKEIEHQQFAEKALWHYQRGFRDGRNFDKKKPRKKQDQVDAFNKAFDEALNQIKNSHLRIDALSVNDLNEKLNEYIFRGWVLIGPTFISSETTHEIHSQLIFKPEYIKKND